MIDVGWRASLGDDVAIDDESDALKVMDRRHGYGYRSSQMRTMDLLVG